MNYEYKDDKGKLNIKSNYGFFNDTDSEDFKICFTFELSETYQMFQIILTKDDLLQSNKIFGFDDTIIFGLIREEPSKITCNLDNIEISYVCQLFNKEYCILFTHPPKQRKEGEDDKYILLEKRVKRLTIENETLNLPPTFPKGNSVNIAHRFS